MVQGKMLYCPVKDIDLHRHTVSRNKVSMAVQKNEIS